MISDIKINAMKELAAAVIKMAVCDFIKGITSARVRPSLFRGFLMSEME